MIRPCGIRLNVCFLSIKASIQTCFYHLPRRVKYPLATTGKIKVRQHLRALFNYWHNIDSFCSWVLTPSIGEMDRDAHLDWSRSWSDCI